MKTNNRLRLLTSTILIGAAVVATPAFAQDTGTTISTEASTDDGEAIVVTGSRIQRRDLTSSSPVAVVNAEEFTLSGSVNIESVINTLPQVVPGATSFSNNPGGGVATLNLRGLGATRNLVLVNGRRYIFFDASQVVDLNTIPQFLIESVDVVTGGASAVYGSDAIAGVINFRLRNDLNGVIAGAQYNLTGEGDGARYNAYAAIGSDFADGRGNVSIFAEYQKRGSIGQGGRDFSRTAFGDGATTLVPGGSAGVPEGRIVAPATLAIGQGASCGGDGNPPRNAGCFAIGEGTNYPGNGAFFGAPGASTPYTTANAYNYAPANFLMVPQERWTLGGFGEYEVSDGINVYAEVNYINNRVENELAATPLTQNVDFNIAAIAPNLSAADLQQINLIAARQQAAIAAAATPGCAPITATNPTGVCANPFGAFTAGTGQFGALQPGSVRLGVNSRFTQISNRNVSDDRNAFRMLLGSRGDIVEGLTYDAYYMYSRTRNASIQAGNVSRSAFTRLAGNGTCNPFGLNQYSDACISGVSILAQNTDISTLEVFQGSVAGELFNSPWSANDAIGFAAGVEYRKVFGQFIPDTALQSGDVVGFNAGQSTEGGYNVKEVFGEVRIPLVSDDFIYRLELSGAGRISDYSLANVGTVYTYAGGVRLAPVQDIEFRANYQRAVRAPNIAQLFGGQSVGFPAATDPCSSRTAVGDRTQALRDLCVATGVPASNVFQAFIQPNDQIQGAFGGNPNLQEEVADTFTAGVVLRPSFIPRLNITVDYYDIEIESAIATAGGGVNGILNLCYNVIRDATGPICNLISRDAQGIISGPPFVVSAGNANLASLATSGIDAQIDYTQPLGFSLTGADESRLAFSFLLNYSDENNFVPTVGVDETIECAGKFGLNCGNPTPKWKWSSRLALVDGPMTLTGRWRHTGAVTDDDDDTDYIVERLKSYNLFDLAFAYDVNDNFTFNMGVNNLFNKQPPILGANQEQANTYPGVYDVLGRDFFVSGQLRF